MFKYNPNSVAILPTRTSLNTRKAQANMYHADWAKQGTYLLMEHRDDWSRKTRRIVLFTCAHAEQAAPVGAKFHAHHDQTSRDLGNWTVIAQTPSSQPELLPAGSFALYTYK